MSDTSRPYFSQPALHGDHLVLCAAGDLWSLRLGERTARRLTSVAGGAKSPRFSPDGKWLAFAAREDGPLGVYVMRAEGGEARRLVHQQSACEPVAFTPDGERVLFVSVLASTTARTPEIFSVTLDGTDIRRMGWGPASSVALTADGRMALSRGYQDPAAWKHYRGGLAGELWAGQAHPLSLRKLTTQRATESLPGFWGDRVVFLTDADGTGNVWSCDMDGGDRRKHTLHDEHFVRWPCVHGSRVAYQHAGDAWIIDLGSGVAERVDADIAADVASVRRRYVEASRFLTGASPSADGSRILVTARGKAVVMPAWRGPAKSVGDEDGVRFSHAEWMPDGAVALVHDASGEDEVEVRSLDPKKETRRFGRAGEGTVRRLLPSPDGAWLAVSEMASGLTLIKTEDGTRIPVDRAASGAIVEMSWSPDSRWLAYAKPRRYRSALWLFEVATQARHAVTTPEFDDGNPCFDPLGRYLWFLSRRVYNPYADELQHDVAFPATTKPYAVILQADRPSPFAPLPQDELGLEAKKGDDKSDAKDATAANGEAAEGEEAKPPAPPAKKTEPVRVRIDLDGLAQRIVEVPVPEGRYADLLAAGDRIFLLRRQVLGMAAGDDPDGSRLGRVVAYDLAAREEKPWANEVRSMRLSLDGKFLLVRGGGDVRLISATKPPAQPSTSGGKPGEKTGVLDLTRVRVRVEPRAEWRQIFREAWRQQRGHFWTGSMSDEDWATLFRRYEPLAERVRTRDELSDVLWDLQGELGTSHAYVVGGDEPWRPNYRVGMLGADIAWDEAAQCHRIMAIHAGDTWLPGAHSPLAMPGVNVHAGDCLLAIDGRPCGRGVHPWALLERPGQAVTLTVATDPKGSDARDVVVSTLRTEHACRYREWVRRNQSIVDERTGGRVGYVHVPDMQVAGLVEFHRGWLWQAHRDAIIVDVRDNGGGNVSQILLEKLSRKLLGFVKARWAEPEPLPYNTVVGPMVALCNERTGSDGDIFCQSWKQLGLGPLIGKRTWGGVIGIDRGRTLVDGGYATQPEYAFWFTEQGWEVEGHGVAPDIEVDITPMDHAASRDPQLERAIAEVMRRLDERGTLRPELPPPPNRARGLRRG